MLPPLQSPWQKGLYYPLMLFCCLEVALRILGYQHFRNDDYQVQAKPPNAFVGDTELGIALSPGSYELTINEGLKFGAQHKSDGSRHLPQRPHGPTEVLLLGCSFTYGYGVDDAATFPALLQGQYPTRAVHNAAVPGYGTVQAQRQLQTYADSGALRVVLLHFSTYHFMRNTLSQQYRSNLKIGYNRSSQQVNNLMQQARFPYRSSCDAPTAFSPWPNMYNNWHGRDWLAAVNWLQTAYDRAAKNHTQQLEVTACLISEMQQWCNAQGITFGLICLDNSPETTELHTQLPTVNWLNVGFDFADTTLTNHPYDSHPSPEGHAWMAGQMELFWGQLLKQADEE